MEHEGISLCWQGASSYELVSTNRWLMFENLLCVFIYFTVVKSMCLESDCMGWNHCDPGQVTFFNISFSLCRKRINRTYFRELL